MFIFQLSFLFQNTLQQKNTNLLPTTNEYSNIYSESISGGLLLPLLYQPQRESSLNALLEKECLLIMTFHSSITPYFLMRVGLLN